METVNIEELAKQFEDSTPTCLLDHTRKRREGIGFILTYLNIHKDEVIYSKDISINTGLTTARIAAALNKLEEYNLIERITCGNDKRKTVVRLTQEGMKKVKKMHDDLHSFFSTIVKVVGEDKIHQFISLAREINDAAKEIKEERENNVQAL